MKIFEKLDQKKYDEIKIFLVTKFNMIILQNSNPKIIESFEIQTQEGKITGNYFKEEKLSLDSSNPAVSNFLEISEKINEILSQPKDSEKQKTGNASDNEVNRS